MARTYVGTSGWNYKHWWNGVFYDRKTKPAEWLESYARHFDTVEINNSFYRLPTNESFSRWRNQVEADFVFAVKASRFITHIKRLKDPEEPVELLMSRVKHLHTSLGPLLFQLPPRFKADIDRLKHFLEVLHRHGNGRTLRTVLEVRDPTWLNDRVYALLRSHNTGLCLADWRDMPVTGPVTADFVYVRRHRGRGRDGNYGRAALDADVARIRAWQSKNLEVYMYFNNDWQGYAIDNAKYVQRKLYGGDSSYRDSAVRRIA